MKPPSLLFLFGLFLGILSVRSEPSAPSAIGPTPSINQLRWQEMEFYGFIHLSLNTYTDHSWGFGDEDVALFRPEELDCREWARLCKEIGMKGIILTAKHHGGFCLWPSQYTEYSVKNSPWRGGKGDLVREMSDACKEYGLKFGIYLSPWDRNRADYGSPLYLDYFRNQLTELLTHYGPIFEVWFDGANGGTGYYGGARETRQIDRTTYYDWATTYALARRLQPDIVIWNDGGDRADLRWVGTEEGEVGETNWSLLNRHGEVTWDMLHFGLEGGDAWVPGEVNTSVRPEWFYHPAEDDKVKTVPRLMETYYRSIGRNATLLLNFPIMPSGKIHPKDEAAVRGMAKAIQESFSINLADTATATATNTRGDAARFAPAMAIDHDAKTFWATDDGVIESSLTLSFKDVTRFNRFLVQEYIALGQRVQTFHVEAFHEGRWSTIASGTTMGYKRILRFPSVLGTKVRLTITSAKGSPLISNLGVFNAPVFLSPPSIRRDQGGRISLSTDDIGPDFYYTLDGSEPTSSSTRYSGPFATSGKVQVRAIAFDPATQKSSPVHREEFDVVRANWRLVGITDPKAAALFDGDPGTVWHTNQSGRMPSDLVIDLGDPENLIGISYLPDQNRWSSGLIKDYQLAVSADGQSWKVVSEGEFSNIKNNPVEQLRLFEPTSGRYVRVRALSNTEGTSVVGFAEVGVRTAD